MALALFAHTYAYAVVSQSVRKFPYVSGFSQEVTALYRKHVVYDSVGLTGGALSDSFTAFDSLETTVRSRDVTDPADNVFFTLYFRLHDSKTDISIVRADIVQV